MTEYLSTSSTGEVVHFLPVDVREYDIVGVLLME
jgi:hypothetical protein